MIYSKGYEDVSYGYDHPFSSERFRRTLKYFQKTFPDIEIIEPEIIDESLLELVHTSHYIELVKRLSKIGKGALSLDTPAFKGMFNWALLYTSGSISATKKAKLEKVHVFNPCGGLHHAQREIGGGFCVFNDVALAAIWLFLNKSKPAVVDWDAHAGDGTMLILYDKPILKISIHEDPLYLYPGRGFVDEVGKGEGYGFTINIPLPPLSTDREFMAAIDKIVIPALNSYKPDIIILQSGADGHYTDPLTHLNYTVKGYKYAAERLRKMNIPIVMLGGGGYDLDAIPIIWATVYSTLIGKFDLVKEDFNKIFPGEIKVDEKVKEITDKLLDYIIRKHPYFREIT